MDSKSIETVDLRYAHSIQNQDEFPFCGEDVSGLLEIPKPVFNNMFQYLTIDNMVNISITCSNDYVDDFLKLKCTPKS